MKEQRRLVARPGLRPRATRTACARISGGRGAPHAARRTLRSLLEARLDAARLADALLAVDELVTNSVRHADVGPDKSVSVEILVFADRVRLCVVDPGSTGTPHVTARRAPDEPGGLGLVVIDRLSAGWGVARDGTGVTRTWCDLLLEGASYAPPERRLG